MANYHYSSKIIGRSSGRSATGAAAYRAGDRIEDRRTGTVFDFKKKGGCDDAIILVPKNAPDWMRDRAELWNRVEEKENRHDAQLSREVEFSLPVELTTEQMKDLALSYVQEQFVDIGMVADIAFHKLNTRNPHCHVMLTMRDVDADGFGNKNRAWNNKAMLGVWREQWANHANKALEKAGHTSRIDHRSLLDQFEAALDRGDMDSAKVLNRVPQVHEGWFGPRQEWAQAENIERMGQTWQLREEWDAIEKKAWAEARLMASASDQTPTKETPHDITQPTGRWKRTPRTIGRVDHRPTAPPLTHHSIHFDRLRHETFGTQPVPDMSGSDRDATVQRRWSAERGGDPLRSHEQRYRSDREAMHIVQSITKHSLNGPLKLSVGQTPPLRMSSSYVLATAVQRPAMASQPHLPAQPKAGRPSLPRKSKNPPSNVGGKVRHNRLTADINATEHEKMMVMMANLKADAEEAAMASMAHLVQPTTDNDVREWAGRKMDLQAIQWHDADQRATQAKKWLDDHRDAGSRRLDARDKHEKALTLAQINFDKWQHNNPAPKRRLWNKDQCARWDQAHATAKAPLTIAETKFEEAEALTSLIAHRNLEQERMEKIRQHHRAIEQRRAIRLLPSETAEAKNVADFKFPPRPNPTTDDIRAVVIGREKKPNAPPSVFKPKGL